MEFKYFTPTQSFWDAKAIIDEQFSQSCKEAQALAESIGAKNAVHLNGKITGFSFKERPEGDHWKKDAQYLGDGDRAYFLKLSHKTSKPILEKMRAITLPTYDDILDLIGLRGWRVMGEAKAGRGISLVGPCIEEIGNESVLKVPIGERQQYQGHELLTEITLSDYYTLKAKAAA